MTDIIQKDDNDADVLRQDAKPVSEDEIGSDHIQNVIEQMKEALAGEDDGVAIAAPQIGESLQIFVVASAVFKQRDKHKDKELQDEYHDRVYINPEIINTSSNTKMMKEGCLSCRWLYGEVERADKATVRALDEDGNKFQEGASGLLAQIFQHETDHLEGTLFIDKAENLHEEPPSNDTEKTSKKD